MNVQLVRQEDSCGCVVASLAMVTGRSYAEVKAWFVGCDLVDGGLTHHDAETYLGDEGFRFARKYRWLPGTDAHGKQRQRASWPPAPFAPAHIIGTRGGRHAVVWLPDGTVFEPQVDRPRRFAEFGDVSYVIGVWPVGGSCGCSP